MAGVTGETMYHNPSASVREFGWLGDVGKVINMEPLGVGWRSLTMGNCGWQEVVQLEKVKNIRSWSWQCVGLTVLLTLEPNFYIYHDLFIGLIIREHGPQSQQLQQAPIILFLIITFHFFTCIFTAGYELVDMNIAISDNVVIINRFGKTAGNDV